MKKLVYVLVSVLAFLLFLSGCVAKSDYEVLVEKVSSLEQNYSTLEEDYKTLSTQYSDLKSEYDEFVSAQTERNAEYDTVSSLYSKATGIPDEVYSSPASENGMASCGWLIEGDITQITSYSGWRYIVVNTEKGEFAIGEMALYAPFPEDWAVGDNICVNFEYYGYSEALDLPMGVFTGFYIMTGDNR